MDGQLKMDRATRTHTHTHAHARSRTHALTHTHTHTHIISLRQWGGGLLSFVTIAHY